MASPAAAPPGDLDPTFDGDGKVTTDFAGGGDQAYGMVIQGDGKIVVGGATPRATAFDVDFALARYNLDGSLDTTFDGDGRVTTSFFGRRDVAGGVAIQGEGKIVAAGNAGRLSGVDDFALARYNLDGSLDTTFDSDGKATTDFAGNGDGASDVAIQGEGNIVAAGEAEFSANVDLALARYNSDGSLDTTFDGDGKVTTDVASGRDHAAALGHHRGGKDRSGRARQHLRESSLRSGPVQLRWLPGRHLRRGREGDHRLRGQR